MLFFFHLEAMQSPQIQTARTSPCQQLIATQAEGYRR